MSEIALADAARESLLKVEDLREQRDDLDQLHAEERKELLKPIKKEWAAMEKRQKAQAAALTVRLKEIEDTTKAMVIELGETVQGNTLQCCYAAGRRSANFDMLDGMIPAYPSIANALSTNEPSASIRALKS